MIMKNILKLLLLVCLGFISVSGQTLTVVSWNIESGDATDNAVAQRIKEFQDVDIWGLSEVQNDDSLKSAEAAAEHNEPGNPDFKRELGQTGGADRLGIIYNSKKFTLLRTGALNDLGGGGQRAPFFAELKDNATGKSFIFMVNHLARGDAAKRRNQATGLNTWVKTQTMPVIAVGDYNFDYDVIGGDQPGGHDLGFDNMIGGNAWKWVKPATLVKSQCSPEFNSVLDFVFVSTAAQKWKVNRSEIIVKENDCIDDAEKPDHRPLIAVFDMSAAGNTNIDKNEILRRIDLLEKQLKELKTIVQDSPGK